MSRVKTVTAELYSFICDAILFICTHAHRSLRSETIITEDCWIRNMVCVHGSRGVFLVHCWLGVWTGMANDSSANTVYIYWRSLWGCTLLGDGKLKLKHIPAAKKSDTKKFKNVKMEQDVGKADEQKAWKQGRDDSVNISVYNSTLKLCTGCCALKFYMIIPTLFPCFAALHLVTSLNLVYMFVSYTSCSFYFAYSCIMHSFKMIHKQVEDMSHEQSIAPR